MLPSISHPVHVPPLNLIKVSEGRVDHAEAVSVPSSSSPSLQGVVGAVFSERCQLRKGLAELDAQERQLNWKIRSKENYIRRLESLGAGPEKKDKVGVFRERSQSLRHTNHHSTPYSVRVTFLCSCSTLTGLVTEDFKITAPVPCDGPLLPLDRSSPGWHYWRPR